MDRGAKSVNACIAPFDISKRNMLMPKKPTLLLHLLNLALNSIVGETKASSNQLIALPQRPAVHDRETWGANWMDHNQGWRTEPEIDRERQAYLASRRAIEPNSRQGIYPFKDVKLSRADVEWLLATHHGGRGPLFFAVPSEGPHMRGL